MVWDKIALTLTIIGALNWGCIGIFGFDVVAFLCGGQMAVLSRIIYTLVGLAGIWCVTLLFRDCLLYTSIRDTLLAAGALGAGMRGSAPTVFGIFREEFAAWEARTRTIPQGESYVAKPLGNLS